MAAAIRSRGKFDAAGHAQSVVKRAGKTPVTASLDLDSLQDRMTGVISNADWTSLLHADRAVFDTARNTAPVAGGRFTLVIPAGSAEPVGYLAVTNTPGGTALVSGALPDGTSLLRTAPMAKDLSIPLFVPLYSGKGLFLGWITATNNSQAVWVKPGFSNATPVLLLK